MVRLIRLCLLVLLSAAWPVAVHADSESDRETITRVLARGLINEALIARERARPDVPDDFAANMLIGAQRWIRTGNSGTAGQSWGRAAQREARATAARVIGATPRTDYLQSFPDPQKVRADLAAASPGVSDVELAGRQAGRVAMLANALGGLQGSNTPTSRWPADVLQLQARYRLYYHDLTARMQPTFTDTCPRWKFWCRTRQETFYNTRVSYEYDLERAQEVAALYIPEAMHDRFVDATGIGGSRREHAAYQQRLREEREAREAAQDSGVSSGVWGVVIMFGLIGGTFLLLGAAALSKGRKDGGRPPLSDNHGSAQWGRVNEPPDPKTPLRGIFLGKYAFADRDLAPPVFTKPEAHTLIMAPTRTGKGTRIIVPTLLRYMGSMLVIDPKGENAAIAGRQRLTSIGPTYILNPWGVLTAQLAERGLNPSRYNPLDVIRRGDPDAVSIAHTMAETICARSEGKDSAYWEGNATAILTAVLLWLADRDGETKTLARVRQIVTLPLDRLQQEYFVPMSASTAFGGAIAENIGPFLSGGDSRDLPAILRTLAEATRFVSDERLKAATAVSDFKLTDMVAVPVTVFLIVPPTMMKVQGTWLRLMLAAVAHTYRTSTLPDKWRGMMLIDELPALGKIPDLPTDLATMSGYGLDYTLIVQDMGQLKAIYGEQSRTILANCGWKWLCNVRDYDTAKYVSDTLGQATVGTETVNEGTTPQGETTHGKAYGEMGRSLLTPDEVMNLGRDRAIVLPPAGRPYQVWGVDYWTLLEQFRPYAETTMQVYYAAPLLIDPNPWRQQAQGQEQAAQ